MPRLKIRIFPVCSSMKSRPVPSPASVTVTAWVKPEATCCSSMVSEVTPPEDSAVEPRA